MNTVLADLIIQIRTGDVEVAAKEYSALSGEPLSVVAKVVMRIYRMFKGGRRE